MLMRVLRFVSVVVALAALGVFLWRPVERREGAPVVSVASVLPAGAIPGPLIEVEETDEPFPFEVRPTSLVRGTEELPEGVLWVELQRPVTRGVVRLADGQVESVGRSRHGRTATAGEGRRSRGRPGGVANVEVEVEGKNAGDIVELPYLLPVAAELPLRVELLEDERFAETTVSVSRPPTDWTLHFVPGFHYDPVWWNTQAHYTETGKYMDSHVGPGLDLVEQYIEACEADPDYRVALHQLPYLKTFLEARPWLRERLEAQLERGAIEAVGATYNELSTTLVNAESTLRNAIYGALFQREVLGQTADTFWQCDVFGHDPSFPSLMARTGHEYGAFARGPFHQWGAPRDQVNFPSEFWWTSPDGGRVLTHYMTGHYGYAYAKFATGSNRASDDPRVTNRLIAEMFEDLKRPALTRNVMLPMHMDFVRPLENLGDVVRAWNEQHLSPKAVLDTSAEFFAAVEEEIAVRGITVPVITRDMNPIYTGCAVSFADLKLANRACENVLREAEIFATLASIVGADYPWLALDRAWRQVLFNAHHDGVTGSMSDQVYLDIMAGYRDALTLATEVRERALAYLASRIDTSDVDGQLAFGASSQRGKMELAGGLGWGPVFDADALAPATSTRADGSTVVLDNGLLRVTLDLEQGGALVSVLDVESESELLAGPANDLVLVEEYAVLPGHGEGPWHLAPTGVERAGTSVVARVVADESTDGRVVVEADYPEFSKRQTISLAPGAKQIDFETRVVDWKGSDQLLRVVFPLDLPGTRPLFQTASAVVGRPFARDVDTAEDSWTLDQTCWQWAGLGAAVVLELVQEGEVVYRRALGVGEIVIDDEGRWLEVANELALRFAFQGVTTTITRASDRRYGDIALDSNVPDFRVLIGENGEDGLVTSALVDAWAGSAELAWAPGADGVPSLVVSPGTGEALLGPAVSDGRVRIGWQGVTLPPGPSLSPAKVALVNEGSVSVHATEGQLALNLMRSCTSWPSGVWMDPPERRLPDGAPFGTMHGSHEFRYSLVVAGEESLNVVADRVQNPVRVRSVDTHTGTLPPEFFPDMGSGDTIVTSFRPRGFDPAAWTFRGELARPETLALRVWSEEGGDVRIATALQDLDVEVLRAYLDSPGKARKVETIYFGMGLGVADGDEITALDLVPNGSATVFVDIVPRARDSDAPSLDPTVGDVDVAEYWLENRGEGVTANGVFSLVPREREALFASGLAEVELWVVNNHQTRSVTPELSALAPAMVDVAFEPASLTLEPDSSAFVTMTVTQKGRVDPPAGRGLVTVRAGGDLVRPVRTSVWLAGEGADPDAPAIEVVNAAPVILGGRDALVATVRNLTDGPVPATARWMLPMSMWEHVPDWQSEIVVPARGEVELTAPVGAALDNWALLAVAFGGTVVYGETVAIVSDPEKVIFSFDVDRVRLRRGEETTVRVLGRSLEGLSPGVNVDHEPVTLELPDGFSWGEKVGASAHLGGPVQEKTWRWDVIPGGERERGEMFAVGPDGSRIKVAYSVAPEQLALPTWEDVVVDGDLSEWDLGEFTSASGELGSMRCAARYGSKGLAFAFEVDDDAYRQPNAGGTIWEGDSVQIALTVSPSTDFGYGGRDLEFGAALTPDGPLVWSWYSGDGGRTGRMDESEVAVRRTDTGLVYEFTLPRSVLPRIPLEPGSILGFSYIANDDDGDGYAGATQWTGGMVGGKDSSLFGELVLVKE